jgi:hypothetical protein
MDSRALTEAIKGARSQPFLFGLFPALSGLVGSTDIFEGIRPVGANPHEANAHRVHRHACQRGVVLTLARRESLSVDCNKETLKCSSSGWLIHRISGDNHRFSSQWQVAQALTGNTSSREKWRVGKLAHGPLGDRCPRADAQPTVSIVRRAIKALHSPTATSKGYGCLVRMRYFGGPVLSSANLVTLNSIA